MLEAHNKFSVHNGENTVKSKFEEFYYEDDKNYPVDVYWNLYDKNHAEAIRKYEGHIFCPLCRLAPLTVAKGNERRYFKVVESDMDKHDIDCSYRRKKVGKRETEKFYKDLDTTDIRNRLVSCMNRMLKKLNSSSSVGKVRTIEKGKKSLGFFDIETEGKEIKYLPHKNIYAKDLETDIDIQKIYYGKCSLYLIQYVPEVEEVKAYYLKVLNQETKKQICDIAISPFVYNYMKEQLDMLPDNKMTAKDFYICFSGVLEKSRYSYKCKLRDSRLLVLEKID